MSLKCQFDSYTFFPAQHWDHTWERQHEIATRLAREIDEKIYVCKPLGMINYSLFRLSFYKKIKNYLHEHNEKSLSNPLEKNMELIFPHIIPYHNEYIGKLNFTMLRSKMGFSNNNFFWSTYINPTIYEFFRRSKFKVYDIAERRAVNPLVPEFIKKLEKRVVREADVVFVDNHAAYEDYHYLNPNIYYVPQGVNVETFKVEASDNHERKYIGYIGNLHFAIDYELLKELVIVNPGESFLFVGKIMDRRALNIMSLPNVTHVEQVPKSELKTYLSQMKCGLIPYVLNEVTQGVFPTKLFEYIAASVPVISTALPEVVQYYNPDYLQIIDGPIHLDNHFEMHEGFNLLEENTWETRWQKYISSINKCLK